MAVTKVTLVDGMEKMRAQTPGYSIIIPQIEDSMPNSEQTTTKKRPKVFNKKRE